MKIKLIFAGGLAVVAGLLAGCETTPLPANVERGPDGTIAYDCLIEASEPGAKIEANGELVGNTPMHLKIFGDKDGTFHNFGSYEFVIRALPLATNQFPQVRMYRTGGIFMPEDHIPKQLFFDMNQNTPPPTYYGGGYPACAPPPYYYYGPSFYFGFPGYYYGSGHYYHGYHGGLHHWHGH